MKPRFVDSFLYAAQGIRTAVREERNMRFHLCAAFYVYLFRCFTALAKQSTFSSRSWYAGFGAGACQLQPGAHGGAPCAGPVHDCGRGERHGRGRGAGIQHRVRGVRRCPVLGCRGVPAHVRFLCGKAAAGGAAGRVSCRGVAVHFGKRKEGK